MAEIVNLRQARKAKARADRDTDAAANRLQNGRSKAERISTAAERRKAGRFVDGHRRDTPSEADETP